MSAVEKEQPEAAKTRFAKDQLKAFVERIERLEEEKKTISDDIRDVYAESKGNGFDVKALRAVIRLRKQDAQERQEHELILETYMNALGMLAAVRPPGVGSACPLAAVFRLAAARYLRLLGAFGGVHIAVDHLKVGHAPIRQQLRPRRVAPLAPDAKQRHAVVDLGGLPQPPAGLRAAPRLQAPQHPVVVARRVPEPPRHHAGGVPRRPAVRPGVPQVAMPAEAIDRLAAHAAEARAAWRIAARDTAPAARGRLPAGRRRADAPRPSGGRAAHGRERARETIGADGVARANRHRPQAAASPASSAGVTRESARALEKSSGKAPVQALPRPPVIQRPCLRHFHAGDRASKA